MRPADRRLFVSALCAISITLASALLLGQPHGSLAVWWHVHWPYLRHLLARKGATAIQTIGALIAFYGLLRAYVRAKYNQTVWAWIESRVESAWRKLFRRPQQVTATGIASAETFGWAGVARGAVTHNVDITVRLHEQIKRLAQFVNDRAREAAEMEKKVTDLGRDLRKLEAGTGQLELNLLERIATQIQQFDDRLKTKQVLDLTWAIWGLAISFVGTVLSLGI